MSVSFKRAHTIKFFEEEFGRLNKPPLGFGEGTTRSRQIQGRRMCDKPVSFTKNGYWQLNEAHSDYTLVGFHWFVNDENGQEDYSPIRAN